VSKPVITKIMRAEMTDEQIAKYIAACELSQEVHLMRLAIYARYNPTIKDLQTEKSAELNQVNAYKEARYKEIYS
jgi:hypothetical protein